MHVSHFKAFIFPDLHGLTLGAPEYSQICPQGTVPVCIWKNAICQTCWEFQKIVFPFEMGVPSKPNHLYNCAQKGLVNPVCRCYTRVSVLYPKLCLEPILIPVPTVCQLLSLTAKGLQSSQEVEIKESNLHRKCLSESATLAMVSQKSKTASGLLPFESV